MEKNLLITLWFANGLHGGVRCAAEIGNYFHSIGYKVWVCGVVTNDVTKEYFRQNNVTLVNVANFPNDIVFDIIWAHHWPIFPFLVTRGIKYKRLVNSTISEFLFVERPIWLFKNIDLHVVLTERLADLFTNKYDINRKKIVVLPNSAPDEYFEYKYTPNKTVRSVAVVSNHSNVEVNEALEILKTMGCETIVYGGGNPVSITPEILSRHDVVITIGRTVQYAMAMGLPVYNYDLFGGSGYITTENLEIESKHNFSGRSFGIKKSPEQIAKEIIDGYENALLHQSDLKVFAKNNYRLTHNLEKIIEKLEKLPYKKRVVINNKNRIFFDYCCAFIDFSAMHNEQRVQVFDYFSKKHCVQSSRKKMFQYKKYNYWKKLNIFGIQIFKIKSTTEIFVLYILGLQIFKKIIFDNRKIVKLLGLRIW